MRIKFDKGLSIKTIMRQFKRTVMEELKNEHGIINIYIQEVKDGQAIPFEETEYFIYKSSRDKANDVYID
jgi:hypothetical protein